MRILVVDRSSTERDATVCLLPSALHEIALARDAAAALAILEEREFDVVLIESTLTGVRGTELVKRIRARESDTHAYVIMTAARTVRGDVKEAFDAGADDFIRKPIGKDELLARIEGPNRIRRWASRVTAVGLPSESDLSALSAWNTVEASICSEVSDMLGMNLSVVTAEDVLDGSIAVSTLPLSLASESAEVCFAVGIDGAASAALAESIFGDPGIDAAAITDMIGEIANVAAGAFKRIAAEEGRAFTTGIPEVTSPERFRQPNAKARRQWLVEAEEPPIRLRFEVELRVRETKRLPVSSLREGMVMAADLLNDAGALLMRQGTRITESNLASMKRALGNLLMVEVAEVG